MPGDARYSGDRVDFDAAGLVAAVGVGDARQDQGELFTAEGWDGVAEVDRRSVRAARADGCGDQQVGPFAARQRADVPGIASRSTQWPMCSRGWIQGLPGAANRPPKPRMSSSTAAAVV